VTSKEGFEWLEVHRAEEPLIVAFPHTGTDIPEDISGELNSVWQARQDTDWWVHLLYRFVRDFGATTVRTRISRSVIDVNRDPSGASLYPGQATTELCPTTNFDGQPLYAGAVPDETEIARRRSAWFEPYHAAIESEITRLRKSHSRIVIYDAHSIRSNIPRLFEGELPFFNIGTDGGTTCDNALSSAIEKVCASSGRGYVTNGRFKGGWTTRHYGRPDQGLHAIQMELAQRCYMQEPAVLSPANWPSTIQPNPAIPPILRQIIKACLAFTKGQL
jgi:N-formylglutamate deformylase